MSPQVKTVFFLGLLSVLLIAIGGFIGQRYGTGYFYGLVALAVVMNFASYFWSDKIVLAMSHAQPVTAEQAPRLHAIVEELAARANIPKPRVYMTPEMQPNAFATGRDPQHAAVAVTQGIMGLLSERELRGVLAHELGHVLNRDILITSIAAMIASAITFIAHQLRWAAIFGYGGRDRDDNGRSGLELLGIMIVAPIAATLIQLAVSRSREYNADDTGAKLCADPEALASALEKLQRAAQQIPADVAPATASLYIVNPFSRGSLMNLFSTHPPLEERIERLRHMTVSGWSK